MEHVLDNGVCISCQGPSRHRMTNGVCSCGSEPLDEDSAALLQALNESDHHVARAWSPEQAAKHIRNPKGSPGGGRFRSNVDRLKDAITAHKAGRGDGHPFDGFDREQLRKVAKARGLELKRGESRDSIAEKLLGHLDHPERVSPPIGPRRPARVTDTTPKIPPTWEELGKPQGPSQVGEVIGHAGGTYERLPGDTRRYRVVSAEGRVITDTARTADDARTALRVDAFDRERINADKGSKWRKTLGAVTGSWSYDTGDIKGFDKATPTEREAIKGALRRWTGDKINTSDETRQAEPRVNTALRDPASQSGVAEQDIRALDLAMSMSKTKRPITVYRGFSNGEHILPAGWKTRDLTGLEWSTKGFTPTSADETVAEDYVGFGEHRGFGIRLKLPKGSPAVAVPDEIGGLDNEGEIVLPRGLTFRVVKDNGVQGAYGNRWLDVELVNANAGAP